MQRSFLDADSIRASVQLEFALEAAAKATTTRTRGPAVVSEEVKSRGSLDKEKQVGAVVVAAEDTRQTQQSTACD